ncbi:hypothetical protein [Emticicia sp. 17c]|uniref:hypothetical protein n=1 Tax=Emticicia sp. 17c TaxID=3127704 RepID=UPI00301BFC46
MEIVSSILAAIGAIADPIAKIFVSKDNVKIANITTEQLKQQLAIAQEEKDVQKIALASKAIELKETETKQLTNQKALQGLLVVAGLGLVGFIAYLLFGEKKKKETKSTAKI